MGFIRVVGTADQGAGFDMSEAHGHAGTAELIKFSRRNVADDGQMFGRRSQVLAEGEHVDAMLVEIVRMMVIPLDQLEVE